MECQKDERLTIMQVNDHTFAATNFPKDGGRIVCEDEIYTLTHQIAYGSLHIEVPCGCDLLIGNEKIPKQELEYCNTFKSEPKVT